MEGIFASGNPPPIGGDTSSDQSQGTGVALGAGAVTPLITIIFGKSMNSTILPSVPFPRCRSAVNRNEL
jgi:hypothetical protein